MEVYIPDTRDDLLVFYWDHMPVPNRAITSWLDDNTPGWSYTLKEEWEEIGSGLKFKFLLPTFIFPEPAMALIFKLTWGGK